MQFKCKKCGNCCGDLFGTIPYERGILVYKEDLLRWKQESREDILSKVIDNKINLLEDKNCQFLKNNLCMIYLTRPLFCRRFPKSEDHAKAYNCIGYIK